MYLLVFLHVKLEYRNKYCIDVNCDFIDVDEIYYYKKFGGDLVLAEVLVLKAVVIINTRLVGRIMDDFWGNFILIFYSVCTPTVKKARE